MQPVLDHPQAVIARAQHLRIGLRDNPRLRQRIKRRAGSPQPQGRIAPAVDELVRLGVKLDLANAAAPALDIEAGAGPLDAFLPGADLRCQPPDLGNRPEIKASPPDEGPDRSKERLARWHITGAGTGTDKCSTFPCQA